MKKTLLLCLLAPLCFVICIIGFVVISAILNNIPKNIYNFASIIVFIILAMFVIICFIFIGQNSGKKSGDAILDFTKSGRKFPKDVPMFRDIPCNKDIYRAYWIAYNFKLINTQTDFIGVILLKWFYENKIRIEKKNEGILNKEITNIIFSNNIELDTHIEEKLYNYLYQASHDGILEKKEFENWCKLEFNKNLLSQWCNDILMYENSILEKEEKLVRKQKVFYKLFITKMYDVDPSLFEEAKQMKGLKDFFNEFENMKDKEAIEVKFWQYYLMYAQIFGLSNKVSKQFSDLFGEVIPDTSMVISDVISI